MPAGRVCMRQVREIVRLGSAGVSKHQIARRTGVVPSTVREARLKPTGYLNMCRYRPLAGLTLSCAG